MKHVGPEDLDNLFTHHPPVGGQVADYQEIRAAGKAFAAVICERVPPGEDRDSAIRRVRDAVMWANAGVACSPVLMYDTGGWVPSDPERLYNESGEPETLQPPPEKPL